MSRIFAFALIATCCITSVVVGQYPPDTIQFESPSSIPATPVSSSRTYSEWFNSSGPSPYSPVTPAPWQDESAESGGTQSGSAGRGGESANGESAGGGAGAAEAVNPTVPLSQLQFQNVFIPESYESSGYSNQFIVQPVLAFNLNPRNFFDYHIIRPTLPIIEPNPDPDGPIGDIGGLGDLTYFDIYVRQSKKIEGLAWGVGPIIVFPTSSNRQTGLGEWQLGPAFAAIKSSKKWIVGFLFEAPFSLESDAYSVQLQPAVIRLLKDDWYVGGGDLLWKLNDQDGNYNIPLSIRIGKVVNFGKQPINIFFQPQYTPAGLTSQPTAKYGFKLNFTFLLPGAEFGYSADKAAKRCGRHCLGCRHCR